MRECVVSRIEKAIVVGVTLECFLCVLYKVADAEGVAQRKLDGHACGRDGDVCVVVP